MRGRRSIPWLIPPIVVATAVTIWTLWMAGFRDEGLGSLVAFLIPPVAIGLVWINARLFPLELDLLWLPPEANDDLGGMDLPTEPAEDAVPVPAPWAPRFQTIEPPITFAGVAIAVGMFCLFAYQASTAVKALVVRFSAPPVETVLDIGNLPITVRLDDDAMVLDSRSDALWTCTMIVPMDGQTVTSTIEIPPRQMRRVDYYTFSSRAAPLTPPQLLRAARATLSATCDDGRGTVRTGNLR